MYVLDFLKDKNILNGCEFSDLILALYAFGKDSKSSKRYKLLEEMESNCARYLDGTLNTFGAQFSTEELLSLFRAYAVFGRKHPGRSI